MQAKRGVLVRDSMPNHAEVSTGNVERSELNIFITRTPPGDSWHHMMFMCKYDGGQNDHGTTRQQHFEST